MFKRILALAFPTTFERATRGLQRMMDDLRDAADRHEERAQFYNVMALEAHTSKRAEQAKARQARRLAGQIDAFAFPDN